jgi:hypothetical protein
MALTAIKHPWLLAQWALFIEKKPAFMQVFGWARLEPWPLPAPQEVRIMYANPTLGADLHAVECVFPCMVPTTQTL